MSLFSFNPRTSVKKAWSFTPDGVIWRLLPTPEGGFVGEARDTERLQTRFFHIDGARGDAYWKGKSWAEAWWTGLETVFSSVVILHEFAKPDMPDHARIHVIDLRSGDLLWSAPDMIYSFATGDRIFALRAGTEGRVDVALDVRTGRVLEEYSFEDPAFQELRRRAGEESGVDLVQFPEPTSGPDGSESEVVEGNGWKVVGAYEPVTGAEPPMLRQRLTVYDEAGRILFREVIHEKARSAVPDLFFVRDGMLYYLKEQRTLTAVVLPGVT